MPIILGMSQRVPEPSRPVTADDLHEQPLQRGFPKWDWRSLPFVLMHVGAVVLPFFTTFSWNLVALAIGLYLVRMFALTGFYHRYFSHRSFKTSRAFQFVMAVWGLTCVQKGPLWWAANHRHHHKHSDQHGDVHSPGLQGFIWAHMGWIMGDDWHDTNLEGVPDLVKYPELRWLDKYHLVPGVTMGVLCYLIGGMPVLVWGFIVSTVINWHVTFMINSLTHMFGRRRYPTKDDSRNSFILALLTLGEGWHNNHHYYQASTRQGFFWWEVDITYYGLKAFSWLGLIWDLREPPPHVVEGRLRQTA
jgi:stearoyl-CoA desaturase (delta-9 desaturase)